MTFEFDNELVPQKLLEVEEIGQCGIEAESESGYMYYMIIRSILGTTTISTCGPVIPDVEYLPSGFKMTLDKMPYKEEKIAKTINFFLNDKTKKIVDAKLVSIEDAISQFRELKDYLLNFSEDTF